jgi:hypothetical protein
MASTGDFSITTAPITVDEDGIGLSSEPLAWDIGSPSECFNTDLWPNLIPSQSEGADINDASHSNAQSAEPNQDDNPSRPVRKEPGLSLPTSASHDAASGLVAPTAPIQRHDVPVKGMPQHKRESQILS